MAAPIPTSWIKAASSYTPDTWVDWVGEYATLTTGLITNLSVDAVIISIRIGEYYLISTELPPGEPFRIDFDRMVTNTTYKLQFLVTGSSSICFLASGGRHG